MSKPKKTASWYARQYIERYGMHLVPIEPGRKFPRSSAWGENCLTDADAAEAFYNERPDWNMGVALGPSGMGSLDIDDQESFELICAGLGVDLQELLDTVPTIKGRGFRPEFKLPEGVELPYRKVNWPSKNDPTGEKHRAAMRAAREAGEAGDTTREARIRAVAKRWANFCVFELRSAGDGKQRQDVYPPSLHAGTGEPYKWHTQPPSGGKPWPEPPAWLLELWQNFDSYKQQLVMMCPWLPEHTEPPQAKAARPRPEYRGSATGVSAADAYRAAHRIESELERLGYKHVHGKRWLSPHSSTGLAGVVVYPDSGKCWIHHASDPLCSESSGQPVDAFDLFTYYDHGGDYKAAAQAAAKQLGIRMGAPVRNEPPAMPPPELPAFDPETGEILESVATGVPVVPAAPDAVSGEVAPAGSTTCAVTAINQRPGWGARDTATPLPWATDKGKPLKHIDNVAEICHRLGVTIRYNVIRKEEELLIPGQSFSLDNKANASLAWLVSECALFDFPTDKLPDFITYLADQNPYNPVARWITSKPWDGTPRFGQLVRTIRVVGESVNADVAKLKEVLIRRWCLTAIAAAFSPNGVDAQGILVLQGPQNLGKTSWLKSLVPADLELVQDGLTLKPDDKDSVKQACSFWLVELGELDATFRKSDVAQLKSFITRQRDVMRRPYARKDSTYARRTVFFGSVNPQQYLHDDTGNRRYWTIECEAINARHDIDMQQLWVEVYHWWLSGQTHYLTAEEIEMLNRHNEGYMALSPVEERILSGLDWESPEVNWRWMQTTDVLIECGMDRPSRADVNQGIALLRKHNGNRAERRRGKTMVWVPPVRREWS